MSGRCSSSHSFKAVSAATSFVMYMPERYSERETGASIAPGSPWNSDVACTFSRRRILGICSNNNGTLPTTISCRFDRLYMRPHCVVAVKYGRIRPTSLTDFFVPMIFSKQQLESSYSASSLQESRKLSKDVSPSALVIDEVGIDVQVSEMVESNAHKSKLLKDGLARQVRLH